MSFSIQLTTQAAWLEVILTQLTTQATSENIDSNHSWLKWLSQGMIPIQLTTQAKNMWFWVDSLFNSDSCPCQLKSSVFFAVQPALEWSKCDIR